MSKNIYDFRWYDHIVLNTSNVEAAINFYVKGLHFTPDYTGGQASVKVGFHKIKFHEHGKNYSPVASHPAVGGNEFFLGLSVSGEDITSWLRAVGINAEIDREGEGLPCLHVNDPDGNIIHIMLMEHMPIEINIMQGLTLHVHNLQKQSAFYRRFLNMTSKSRGTSLQNGAAYLIQTKEDADKYAGSADFCFLTDGDIHEIYRELEARGAPFATDEGVVRRNGGIGPIDSIYLRDPEGNLVEIACAVTPLD